MDYLTIWLRIIREFKISANDALILEYIFKTCTFPESKYPGWCYASKLYMAEIMNISPRALYKIFNNLEEKELIERDQTTGFLRTTKKYNDIHFLAQNKDEKITEQSSHTLNKVHNNTEQSAVNGMNKVQSGTEQSSHNNNKKYINDNLLNYIPLYDQIICFFPDGVKPKNDSEKSKWLDELRKLREIDSLEETLIVSIVKWARENDFWQSNFLSLLKLRKKDRQGIPYHLVFAEKIKSEKKSKPNRFYAPDVDDRKKWEN